MDYRIIIILILLSSCKVKKEINKVQIKEEVKEVKSTNWVRKENVFSKVDGTAQIEFEGLQDFKIDWEGNISVKADRAVMATQTSRIDTIHRIDTVHLEHTIERVTEIKTKDVKKETRSNLLPYIILFILASATIYYFKKSKG